MVVAVGCAPILPPSPLEPEIVCGPAKPGVCARQVRAILESYGADQRRIVRIQLHGDGDDYELTFADGATERMNVN